MSCFPYTQLSILYFSDIKAGLRKEIDEIRKEYPFFKPGLSIVQVGFLIFTYIVHCTSIDTSQFFLSVLGWRSRGFECVHSHETEISRRMWYVGRAH